jgi:tetratricopeptide (TPR) repeat protein
MAERLEAIYDPDHDLDDEYSWLFGAYGIDLAVLPVQEAAERIRPRRIGAELGRALDLWARQRRRACKGGRPDWKQLLEGRPDWKQLLELAKAADSDPWRNRLRNALEGGERKALEALATSADIGQLPPSSLHLLGCTLADVMEAPEEGVALLREAQRQYPGDRWINTALGRLCSRALKPPQYDDAVRFYTAALAARPDSHSIRFDLARVLLEKGSFQEANVEFSKVIELEPYNPDAWSGRGQAFLKLGQRDKALADYSKVIELTPHYVFPWHYRGWSYLRLEQGDKSLEDCSRVIELYNRFAQTWAYRGFDNANLEQRDQVIADCSKAIELLPDNPFPWHHRGWTYLQFEQWDKSLEDFSRAIELYNRFPATWYNRGVANANLKRWDQAVADYSKAIELDPKDRDAWYHRGVANANLERGDQAIADCSKAIELDPKDPDTWYYRAWAYQQLEQWNKSLEDCSRAIELGHNKFAPTWYYRGVANAKLQRWDQAIADCSRAIELDPKDPDTWYQRGAAYYNLGQWENACRDFYKVIDLNPDSSITKNNVTWFLANCPEPRYRDPARAVELAEAAVKLAPKEGNHWNTLGVAQYRAGKWKSAIESLTKSMELLKGQWESYNTLFLAMAHWQLGEKEKARQWYARGAQWMEKNQEALKKHEREQEVVRFCAEAAELLGIKDEKPQHQVTKDTKNSN